MDTLQDKLQWASEEYEERERTTDWFWALGIIITTSAAASTIFDNYFFAGLIILSGILLYIFAKKKPEIISYELNPRGLKIHTRLYPYEAIQSFFVQRSGEVETHYGKTVHKPTLFIKSERIFMPILSIPITDDLAENIEHILLSQEIPEEEMREHASTKIMEFLGF
jgi:hypothetical protein